MEIIGEGLEQTNLLVQLAKASTVSTTLTEGFFHLSHFDTQMRIPRTGEQLN
jgi:hypothetical protein